MISGQIWNCWNYMVEFKFSLSLIGEQPIHKLFLIKIISWHCNFTLDNRSMKALIFHTKGEFFYEIIIIHRWAFWLPWNYYNQSIWNLPPMKLLWSTHYNFGFRHSTVSNWWEAFLQGKKYDTSMEFWLLWNLYD